MILVKSFIVTIVRGFFSLKEILVLSFAVVFSKGGVLDHKKGMLLRSKNFHIFKVG